MKVNILLQLTLFVIVLLINGCATTINNIEPDYALNHKQGVALFSLTVSGECGYALFVDIRDADKNHLGTVGLQSMFEQRDWQRKHQHCDAGGDDFVGQLKAIPFADGTYEIYKLTGMNRYRAFSTEDNLALQFKVSNGRVTYLGNVHFHITKTAYELNILDQRDRDFELFEAKYAQQNPDYIIDLLQKPVF